MRTAALALVVLTLSSWPESAPAEVTVADRLAELAPARKRLRARFISAGVVYPPRAVTLAAFKAERTLEVHVQDRRGVWHLVVTYPVLGLGRGDGPKLRQGDGCTPEGLYRITHLNPNSRYYLSLLIDYPNAHDREQAARDGRTHLGGDIVIHGGRASAGCLAMGDDAVEELFVLAAEAGSRNISVVIAPRDLRVEAFTEAESEAQPPWIRELYASIARRLGDCCGRIPDGSVNHLRRGIICKLLSKIFLTIFAETCRHTR